MSNDGNELIGHPPAGGTSASVLPETAGTARAADPVKKRRSGRATLTIIGLVLCGNLAAWALLNRPADLPSWSGYIQGIAYAPYREGENPLTKKFPTDAEITKDMQILQSKAGVETVRTYSAVDGSEDVPALAAQEGLQVAAGAWLDKRLDQNELELQSLINQAHRYPSITRALVGNESILRADVSVPEMIQYLRRARSQIEVPVSTAEPWHVWLEHPELVKEVDYIAVHILPYWEGVPIDDAVKYVERRYDELRAAYPQKPIVMTEVGWPSKGRQRGGAVASLTNQARFIREFLNFADREGVQYYLMEGFDQPWKEKIEGTAGAYWGLFNADREAKFSFSGPILEHELWPIHAWAAAFMALPVVLFFLFRWRELGFGGRLFFAAVAQAAGAMLLWTVMAGTTRYMTAGDIAVWSVMLLGQFGLLCLLVTQGGQMALMIWTQRLRREFRPLAPSADRPMPKVSLHLPIHNEPAHMVIETIDSLAALDYANLEILVIDNNTKDPAVWRPVEAHCAALGERVRFIHVENLKGFKAGALNLALREMSPDAEIVGVVDSDYIVRHDWLKATVPYFANPKVALVQAPQDHRDWHHNLFKEMINWEYAGFFNLGMVLRNEANAIIQHGTMTLVRRDALQRLGGWAEWCITEDAELGLRLMHEGFDTIYINEPFGKGLTPDSFAGYRLQRFRWAYGAMQILKAHIGWFLPRDRHLTTAQKFHFLAGWLPWIGDGLQLLFTFAALIWTVFLAVWPRYFEFPLGVFVVPALAMVSFKVLETLWLYRAKVNCTPRQRIGAAIAGMSLTHAVAKAVLIGLFTKRRPFMRTPKCEDKSAIIRGIIVAWEEFVLALLLWVGALAIALGNGLDGSGWRNPEALTWAVMLLAQSLPYCASVAASLAAAMPSLGRRRIKVALPAPSALSGSLAPASLAIPIAARAASNSQARDGISLGS
jgi:exo-beta-1,3-glucanase (GH17 family)/cellulose synthase/poly-beta-1,6-N-acetylglucosamine synthase-like glycosyltransferase